MNCRICASEFDPSAPLNDPAAEMRDFMAGEIYHDPGQLSPQCLANPARLTMMYCREYD